MIYAHQLMTNHKLCVHETAFSSFMFPKHGVHMSFAAQGHKVHMVFAPLESPFSDNVVKSGHMNGVQQNRLTIGAHSCKSIGASNAKCLAEHAAIG